MGCMDRIEKTYKECQTNNSCTIEKTKVDNR